MTDPIVPAATKLAAKRGFIRTTAQAYAATLSGGIATSVVLGIVTGTVDLLTVGVTFGVAVVSPLIAGAASYASILSAGIPGDYQDATLAKHSVLTPVEQATDVHHAVEVVARG